MRPGLTILLPTRDRPQQFLKSVESAFATSSLAEKGLLEVLAYVDDDDPSIDKYKSFRTDKVRIRFGKRIGAANAAKVVAKESETEWLIFSADDAFFETQGWDESLIAVIPEDRVGVSYPQDGRGDVLSHFVFHRKLFELTGLWPDGFWHFGPDTYLWSVMREVKRSFFVKKVMIRHLKAKLGLSPLDNTHAEARRFTGRDAGALKNAMDELFWWDVKILKDEIARCAGL